MRTRALLTATAATVAVLSFTSSPAAARPPGRACAGPAPTAIAEIQGDASASPLDGQVVTTEGYVTVDLQADDELRGFFMESLPRDRDRNPATSEGVFVFHGDAFTPSFDPSVGDRVRITAEVDEFFGQTQLRDIESAHVCPGFRRPKPTALSVAEYQAATESFEGMLVSFPGELTVTDTFNLERFGEVWLADGGVVETPTNELPPGPDADALAADGMARSILVDDGSRFSDLGALPFTSAEGTLRLGDTFNDLTGAVGYGFGAYRIQPAGVQDISVGNPRPEVPDVGGDIQVASFNVLNYFTTLGDRGADSAADLAVQTDKLVAAMLGTGAEILALQEVENDPTHAPILALRDALNAAVGADVWSWTGPTDTNAYPIRNEFLYRSDVVQAVGDPVTLADPSFDAVLPGRVDPLGRRPLAQTFAVDGEVFTIVNNHFKSKGCTGASGADLDQGDGQSCFNATRVAEALAVIDFVDALAGATGDDDVLVVGDLNAYLHEDPIAELDRELVNLLSTFDPDPYSYNFFATFAAPYIGRGSLDHALATDALAVQVTGTQTWHINADEPQALRYEPVADLVAPGPYASSDHDPVLIGLDLAGGGDPILGEDDGFVLDILHVNDHHSHLEAEEITLDIAGGEVEFELGGFPRVVAAFDQLEAALGPDANVARIHAGDAITGTLFYTLFGGEADAAMMNEVCFDVFALGNHEFDGSDDGLVSFLDALNSTDCDTATLAANVVPEVGTPLAPETRDDYIQPFTVERYGDEVVGYVGIDIAQKTMVSSQPLDTTQFLDEIATAQRYVDLLTAAGIENIVLVTHQGYGNDIALAAAVSGVDVIVGGDSHSLLGDVDAYGLTSQGEYPTVATDAAGNDVCIVQAWQYSYVVGEVRVTFDEAGNVVGCDGVPHLLLGDILAGDEAAAAAAIAADPQLDQWTPDAAATAALADYQAEVDVLAQEIIGTASEDICVARFPNDGRSTLCPVGTLDHGGEVQQLVTQAFLARAFRADIALQNSGGVRVDIPAGEITIADAYELLPFANTLVELDLTGAEVVLALEQGLSNTLDHGGSTGAFPYGAGIRWDLDASQPFGSRFTNVQVRADDGTWAPIDPTATYVVVANSFMAGGGDGYQVLADAAADGRAVDTFLDYAQSFIDYVVEDAGGVVDKPTEYSLQSYTPAP